MVPTDKTFKVLDNVIEKKVNVNKMNLFNRYVLLYHNNINAIAITKSDPPMPTLTTSVIFFPV